MSRRYLPGLTPRPISVIREHKRVRLMPRPPASPGVAAAGCPALVVQAGKRWNRMGGGGQFLLSLTQREHLFGSPCYVPDILGCGAFACVYTHPDAGRVVKITGDRLDALASSAVYEHYPVFPENLVRVHEPPRHLVGLRTPKAKRMLMHSRRYFAIVLDRAAKPSPVDAKMQRCYDRYFRQNSVDCATMERICKQGRVCDYEAALTRARFALDASGVDWRDDHRGNIMRKGGRWVAVDYGFSTVRADPMPPADLAGLRRPRWQGWR